MREIVKAEPVNPDGLLPIVSEYFDALVPYITAMTYDTRGRNEIEIMLPGNLHLDLDIARQFISSFSVEARDGWYQCLTGEMASEKVFLYLMTKRFNTHAK